MFAVVPAVCYFIGISLVSPFNSDRYVMASLPLIAMLFAFSFIRIFTLFKNQKIRLAVPVCILLASVTAFVTVKPYYTYGKQISMSQRQTTAFLSELQCLNGTSVLTSL